jgi:hypothetical protein
MSGRGGRFVSLAASGRPRNGAVDTIVGCDLGISTASRITIVSTAQGLNIKVDIIVSSIVVYPSM